MDHPESRRGERLDDEVAVADGVEAVRRDPVELQLGGDGLAVDRVARPGKSARSERADVRPAAGVGQSAPVALEHLDVCEQVVGEQHRLRRLNVRRPGQDRLAVPLRQADQRALHLDDRRIEAIDRPAQPEPQVGRDLVVP